MPLISLNFSPEMEALVLQGRKCMTSRYHQKGNPGDVFRIRNHLYRILHVHHCSWVSVRDSYYDAEGFSSPEEFQETWNKLYPDRSDKSETVYLHFFAYAGYACSDFGYSGMCMNKHSCSVGEYCSKKEYTYL